jgi:uncharacterized protein (DUF736 family)
MSVIGHFVPDTDGYVGTIRTLTIHAKLRLVAIDNKTKEDGPDFRIMYGLQEVGAAWKAKTHEAEPRDYLSAMIDDPMFPEPLHGALFEDNGKLGSALSGAGRCEFRVWVATQLLVRPVPSFSVSGREIRPAAVKLLARLRAFLE